MAAAEKGATQPSQELTVKFDVRGAEIKLTPQIVEQYIVGNNSKITMPEFKFFTELCKVRQLNPFLKEAYCVKYGDEPAQIVVSKDVFIERANNHPQYDGKETGVIVLDKDKKMIERNGTLVLPDEELVGGWARVFRKDRSHPEYMSVSLNEVAGKKKDGQLNFNWAKKPATMVEKVAKVRALREAFSDELGSLYDESEFVGEATKGPEIVDVEIIDPGAGQKGQTPIDEV